MTPEPLIHQTSTPRVQWHDEAIDSAVQAMVGMLIESCTVEECEGVIAEIHPDTWKQIAERTVDTYNEACVRIARRDIARVRAPHRA